MQYSGILHFLVYKFSIPPIYIQYLRSEYTPHIFVNILQPQIRKSWDSMENTNKKRK